MSSDSQAARYLAPAVKREFIYWLLADEEGALFFKICCCIRKLRGSAK
ncbi:AraC family transcriptional regulator [Paenibacillus yonginensis]